MQPTVTPFFHAADRHLDLCRERPASAARGRGHRPGAGLRLALRPHRHGLGRRRARAPRGRAACACAGSWRRTPTPTTCRRAPYLQSQAGGQIAIGQGIRAGAGHVQAHLRARRRVRAGRPPVRPPADGRRRDRSSAASQGRVIATPGHTSDSVSYLFGDALFVGDTRVHARWRLGALRLPGRRRGGAVPFGAAALCAARRRRACSSATTTRRAAARRCAKRRSARSARPTSTSRRDTPSERLRGDAPRP